MRLFAHPHVLKLYDFGESQTTVYLFLELAPGGELFKFVDRPGRHLEPVVALRYFRELIYGIDYLHAHGICHRDLKPENLLLDDRDHIKIADFGLARWMRSGKAGTVCGTYWYAAPEVMSGKTYNGRAADIWSCGVILFHILAGRLPFDDPDPRLLVIKIQTCRYKMPEFFTEEAKNLISRILVLDVDKRLTLDGIKSHPIFRLGLPDGYHVPVPLAIMPIDKPIDESQLDPEIIPILRDIGYATDAEIMAELTADRPTKAKMLYQLFRGRSSLALLPWTIPTSTDEPPTDSSPSPSADDTQDLNADLPALSEEINQTVQHVKLKLEEMMALLQEYLTRDGFEWFHPDDFELLAKSTEKRLFLKLLAEHDQGDLMALKIIYIGGEQREFDGFMALLSLNLPVVDT
jgi:BR serine/threonine kinase